MKRLLDWLDDILVIAGAGMVVYAAALFHPIAAWLVAGVFTITGGVFVGLAQRGKA
jgi:hypothetical protein